MLLKYISGIIIICVFSKVQSQPKEIEIERQTIKHTIDLFLIEFNKKMDSIGSVDKSRGVIVIEFFHANNQGFQIGLDQLYKYDFKISMIRFQEFFQRNIPSYISSYGNRLIAIYTGFEYFFSEPERRMTSFYKKVKASADVRDFRVLSCIVKVNEQDGTKIQIIERQFK